MSETIQTTISSDLPRANFIRRLVAILYDTLLLAAVLFVAMALLLPLTGEAQGYNPLLSIYLFMVGFFFFAWFWTHGGQTLGMRAWRLRVVAFDGSPISWKLCALRYIGAIVSWLPLGLGYIWMLWDKDKLTWHDRFSYSMVVLIPRDK